MVSSAFSSVAFDPDGYIGMYFKVAKSHFGIKNFLSWKLSIRFLILKLRGGDIRLIEKFRP